MIGDRRRHTFGPTDIKVADLTKTTGIVAYWPVGCLDAVTLAFRAFDDNGMAAWPTNLVMEIRAGLDPDNLMAWPGGAITLNSTTAAFPYISQELRVFALPFVGFYVSTVTSGACTGVFSCYGEGM